MARNGVYLIEIDSHLQIKISPEWRFIAFLILVPAKSSRSLTHSVGTPPDIDSGWLLAGAAGGGVHCAGCAVAHPGNLVAVQNTLFAHPASIGLTKVMLT